MNSVERVRSICKDRKIPISRLEKSLGYANGYISQLRKGVFPNDRLVEIASYLEVPVDYLLFGEAMPGSELRKIISAESEKRGIPMDELYRAFNERTGETIALNEKNVSEFFDSFFGESAKKSPAVSSEGLTEDEKRILEKFRAASEDKRLAAEYVLGLK